MSREEEEVRVASHDDAALSLSAALLISLPEVGAAGPAWRSRSAARCSCHARRDHRASVQVLTALLHRAGATLERRIVATRAITATRRVRRPRGRACFARRAASTSGSRS